MNAGGVREWLSQRVAPPPDPGLDAFRDAIGALCLDGVVVGYVASRISTFWGLGRPTGLQECLWLYFHYLDDPDGNAERRHLWEEDYPPWTLRPELESGSFHDHDREATYTFRWLEAAARRKAFDLIGLDDGVSSWSDRCRRDECPSPTIVRSAHNPIVVRSAESGRWQSDTKLHESGRRSRVEPLMLEIVHLTSSPGAGWAGLAEAVGEPVGDVWVEPGEDRLAVSGG